MKKSIYKALYCIGFCTLALFLIGCTSGSFSLGSGGPNLFLEYDSSTKANQSVEEEESFEDDPWLITAESVGNEIGKQYHLNLPPGGYAGALWGSGIYTDDSLVGTAAVHSGLITFEEGGEVHFLITEGRKLYASSTRNGVSSAAYGPWPKSFMFVDEKGRLIEPEAYDLIPIEWNVNGQFLQLSEGEQATVFLEPGGYEDVVWGSDPYTIDSSIGSAAVHAGLITFDHGGTITVRNVGPQSYFNDSLRNGVESLEHTERTQAFSFVR